MSQLCFHTPGEVDPCWPGTLYLKRHGEQNWIKQLIQVWQNHSLHCVFSFNESQDLSQSSKSFEKLRRLTISKLKIFRLKGITHIPPLKWKWLCSVLLEWLYYQSRDCAQVQSSCSKGKKLGKKSVWPFCYYSLTLKNGAIGKYSP